MHSESPAPGPLVRWTIAAGAAATAVAVTSAALDLGRGHWGAAIVALPLLVAAAVIAKLAYPTLLAPTATAVVLCWRQSPPAASSAGPATPAGRLRSTSARAQRRSPRRSSRSPVPFRGERLEVGPWRDYVDPDETADHVAPAPDRGSRDVRRRRRPAQRLGLPRDDDRTRACLRRRERAQSRHGRGHRQAHGRAHRSSSGRLRSRSGTTGARVRSRPDGRSRSRYSHPRSTCSPPRSPCSGDLFYVVVYTGYLKRSTDQNIVIGGAAGAVPPLVGFAAATGTSTLPALWLFLIVFLWTPPHFWALALMIKEHYLAANVPMLPGTRGDRETTRQILLYSIVLVAFTVAVGCGSAPSIRRSRSSSARTSCSSPGSCGRMLRAAGRCCSSTTLSPTSPCCSWQRRSTHWSL